MAKTVRTLQTTAEDAKQQPARPFKKQKFTVFLITGDDALWPLVGADLSGDLVLKQLDSVDELLATAPAGQAGIVLWDARNLGDAAATLSAMAQHSPRFAIIVMDSTGNTGVWTLPLQQRQIVANVGLPLSSMVLGKALESAREEVGARMALLGESSSVPGTSGAAANAANKTRWLPIAIGAAIVAAAAAVFVLTRHGTPEKQSPVLSVGSATSAAPTKLAPAGTAAGGAAATDEKVDGLIDKAQQAMLERHFIDPAAGSALALYRDVLLIDPDNGEARQGLQRLAEILIARVQSALDERKFDVALQSLETARSIDAKDPRLSTLDDRIASLRAELGPAQINAALNAQNFDRATQLIEDAARAKSLPPAKLAQLRDDVRKRRDEFDSARLLKLVETRLQQDKLLEPRGDSAAFYLEQAKQAGEPAATLQPLYQELQRQLAIAVRVAIDARHFGDADYSLAEMRNLGAPNATVAGLQKDLTAARAAAAPAKTEQPQYLDLLQSRLAQGKLLEPDNDNALYYLSQLRSADPKNAALPQLSGAVQEQIIGRAGMALDAGDTGKADSLLQQAAALGASPALDVMNDKLRQKTASSGAAPEVTEESLTRLSKLEIVYPTRAQQTGVEGWVEIGFTVNPNGSVANVKVLNANPSRTFEQAAIKAVSKMRYQPVIQGGQAIAVNARFRVVFRIPK
jgi:periplasmic protein TonB